MNINSIRLYPDGDHVPFDIMKDDGKLRAWLLSDSRNLDLSIKSSRMLQTAVGPAFCFEMGNEGTTQVRCVFQNSALRVVFFGEPKHAAEIYDVVASLTAAQKR